MERTAHPQYDPEDGLTSCCGPLSYSELRRPVYVDSVTTGWTGESTFWTWPFLGPLLFENTSSDARDHCANERTFLSYLRLSVYMAIVSVAIVMTFHLKSQPSEIEIRMARPLGIVFWTLSVLCLSLGCSNYIKTVNKYSRKSAIVQHGWGTQSVMALIAFSIIGTCVVLLFVTKLQRAGTATRLN